MHICSIHFCLTIRVCVAMSLRTSLTQTSLRNFARRYSTQCETQERVDRYYAFAYMSIAGLTATYQFAKNKMPVGYALLFGAAWPMFPIAYILSYRPK